MPLALESMLALTARELIRFARQPSRIIASVGTAALFWLFFASGLARSIVLPSAGAAARAPSFAAFLLPGAITVIVVFGTIFASISLIQDRHEGFLQSALVSPAPTLSIVLSKILGGVLITSGEAIVLMLGAPIVGLAPGPQGFFLALLAIVLTAAAVIGLGLALAWRINSVAGFHGVMNLLLLPMWLLSGSFFPVEGAAGWLAAVVRVNPLYWSNRLIAGALGSRETPGLLAWAIVGSAALGSFALAMMVMSDRRLRGGSGTGGGSA